MQEVNLEAVKNLPDMISCMNSAQESRKRNHDNFVVSKLLKNIWGEMNHQ